ncbi:hypothetical protein Ctob_002887 [Chrysochromulina tobinii]|uniref:RRM domain-containing protein n=1 Tax=Chrysochromulina tobinii TaxID=1460289 RepID=A0A0M0J9F3_9EUKA|nr:hypothetical protein Ctob_002887 [Chrysochromulina tobinii]|eukprot:KOO23201.1 hypothetical protein Ctob_002887 [Chrysochromulina sp. CCMP291]
MCHRASTVWLGGVRPCDDAAAVTTMMAPFEVRNVTLRRKGWRNSQTRERIGFALVQLASEEAVEAALAHFNGSPIDVRPHRWQPPSSQQHTDDEDPLAPLLGEASSTAALGEAASTAADEPPGMPTLEQQLEPLTISQARVRLQRFGCGSNDLAAAEARAQQHVLTPLLTELRGTKWPLKKGRNVDAAHYLVLGVPAPNVAPRLLGRYARLWELATKALWSLAPAFEPTSIAVTHNFVGSPHVDVGDTCAQYCFSCGDFGRGGELCIEASPTSVVCVDTHDKLARIDGRFPHWVAAYEGERFSVVFYRLEGPVEPVERAVHDVPSAHSEH